MVITRIYRTGNMLCIETDAFPNVHPAFEIKDLANSPQTIDKLKDRLRDISANVPGPTPDPYAQKFAVIKADLEGSDIGEL